MSNLPGTCSPGGTGVEQLIRVLDPGKKIVIQAHDFPDHDAVAAGFGLWTLLRAKGIPVDFCYSGTMQSPSLEEAIRLLEIPIVSSSCLSLDGDSQIILVDGFIGNKNVTDIPGQTVALIDHHNPPELPEIPYWDIRNEYGSCSTIIYDYFAQAGVEIPYNCATSLLMGLLMDTAFMTRGVHPKDLTAFSGLFFQGDWHLGSRLLRNSLTLNDMDVFKSALGAHRVHKDFCFIPLDLECSPEVSALVADFFLNLREINFVVVLVPDQKYGYRLSVRSADKNKPSDLIIRRALQGRGNGGGHMHMGGGQVSRDQFPGVDRFMENFVEAIEHYGGFREPVFGD